MGTQCVWALRRLHRCTRRLRGPQAAGIAAAPGLSGTGRRSSVRRCAGRAAGLRSAASGIRQSGLPRRSASRGTRSASATARRAHGAAAARCCGPAPRAAAARRDRCASAGRQGHLGHRRFVALQALVGAGIAGQPLAKGFVQGGVPGPRPVAGGFAQGFVGAERDVFHRIPRTDSGSPVYTKAVRTKSPGCGNSCVCDWRFEATSDGGPSLEAAPAACAP